MMFCLEEANHIKEWQVGGNVQVGTSDESTDAAEDQVSAPQFEAMEPLPGQMIERKPSRWLTYFAGKGGKS